MNNPDNPDTLVKNKNNVDNIMLLAGKIWGKLKFPVISARSIYWIMGRFFDIDLIEMIVQFFIH